MRKSLMIAGLVAAIPSGTLADGKPVLTVHTYDSFVADWGPGPAVETAFEATCDCDLVFVAQGDAGEMLSRLMFEGKATDADVMLGLDTNLFAEAEATGLLAPHGLTELKLDLPTAWTDPVFVPFDWGYFAFVYDRNRVATPPESFQDLAASDMKIVIQDPRSSSPGLGLLMWVKAVYGAGAGQIWRDLADNIVTVTPGWSEAYGLFLEGEADLVLSYTTSPAYHVFAESDDNKAAAPFREGHYLQVEAAAKLAGSDQPELADRFMAFILSPEFQSVIPRTNWMYPAVTPETGLPDEFQSLIRPQKAILLTATEAHAIRRDAIEEWREALSQ